MGVKLCWVLLVPLACTSNASDQPAGASAPGAGGQTAVLVGDGRAFVPEDLPNTPMGGQVADGLRLIAFTLRQGASGLALYGAVKNERDTPACEGGMTTYFIDTGGQVVTSATSVLESAHFYRREAGEVIRCLAPGEVGMTALVGLPNEIALEQLGSLQHAFPAFTVNDIAPVEALSVSDVKPVTTGVGTLYAGTLMNGLDVTVSTPRVTVFPVNRVGRPLGMATSGAASELAAQSTWNFETGNVDASGVAFTAYPNASIAP